MVKRGRNNEGERDIEGGWRGREREGEFPRRGRGRKRERDEGRDKDGEVKGRERVMKIEGCSVRERGRGRGAHG